jgi:hypothetical protein
LWFSCKMLDLRFSTAVTIRSTVSRVVTQCSLEIAQHFGGTYCLHHQGWIGGAVSLWSVGLFLTYMGLQSERPYSSFKMFHEQQFLKIIISLYIPRFNIRSRVTILEGISDSYSQFVVWIPYNHYCWHVMEFKLYHILKKMGS